MTSDLSPGPDPSDALQVITCPECGQIASINPARRDAVDFCRTCDYPLFWTPSQIEVERGLGLGQASLRRLPGTVGHATLASLICPHCAEPNAVTATVCLRCNRLLHVVDEAPAPPPEPPPAVYVPEPVYVEPARVTPWWVWALIGLVLAALIAVGLLLANHTISWPNG